MSLNAARVALLPHVSGALHYLAPMNEKPRQFTYELPQGIPETNARYERRRVRIYDARPIVDLLSLDREGFQLTQHKTSVRDFQSDAEVRRVYYPEAERLVTAATGARWSLVFDHTVRERVFGTADRTPGAPRQPTVNVHNDYTELSAPQRVRDLTGLAAEALLRKRFAIIHIWRPLRGPLYDAPLAICDAATMRPEDLVATDLYYRDRVGETYGARYNPEHRWLYISGMTPDEVLLMKCYDSHRNVARFAPHCAFDDPSAPADMNIHASVELRALAFFAD
jgi:hypothetical protein